MVGVQEIRANHANLNIPLYVQAANGNGSNGTKALHQVIAEWEQSADNLRASMNTLFTTLMEAGLDGEETCATAPQPE